VGELDRGGAGEQPTVTLLSLSDVTVEFGATTLLRDVTVTIAAGEKWGIVGRNGTGKTTLFRLITGALAPSSGQVARVGGTRVSLLEQHRDFGEATTIWEAAAGEFAELLALERLLATQAAALETDASESALARYGQDLERFEREGGYTIAPRVDAVLHGLGFDPTEARSRAIDTLSGGERGRLGLARQLVSPADVLLLDEPTNHLDLETTQWLEQYLQQTAATVLLISHDRAFLAAVADHILHVDEGTATPYTGGYESFVMQHAERLLTRERALERQRRQVAKEEEYIRRNIAGQNSRQAKGRRTRLARLPRLSAAPGADDAMAVVFDSRERGGDQVLDTRDLRVEIEGRVLVRDLDERIMRGERVGLIGPNGAGKSTLLQTIVGDRPPTAGVARLGGSITVAHYRQDLAQVPLTRTLYDIVSDLRPLWTRGQIQGHLARFGFSGEEVMRRADTLSGGERARVALAMIMLSGANLLIFDEPTNHLDVESIEALEDAVERYPGTVLLVSHDRALLRALVTRVWVLHEQRITSFEGSFAEWEVASEERAHAAAVAASEEEALRRVREHRRTERRQESTTRQQSARRAAQLAASAAMSRVAQAESEVARITSALADPSLYTTPDGVSRSVELGTALERARRALDAALETWTAAEEALS
jgi:ATP-binding cassette, subfamily F, member 3